MSEAIDPMVALYNDLQRLVNDSSAPPEVVALAQRVSSTVFSFPGSRFALFEELVAKHRLIVEVRNGVSSKPVEVSEVDARHAHQAYRQRLIFDNLARRAELVAKVKDCKHPVCYDDDAFPYYSRYCLTCGNMDMI